MNKQEIIEHKELEMKVVDTMEEAKQADEDAIIREVAEEEGLTYEEVKEMWEIFKQEAQNAIVKKPKATKPKVDKAKKKQAKKQAKKSKKRNR
jgi:hypothetical protein